MGEPEIFRWSLGAVPESSLPAELPAGPADGDELAMATSTSSCEAASFNAAMIPGRYSGQAMAWGSGGVLVALEQAFTLESRGGEGRLRRGGTQRTGRSEKGEVGGDDD